MTIPEERHKLDLDIVTLQSKIPILIGAQFGKIFPKDVLNSILVQSRQ